KDISKLSRLGFKTLALYLMTTAIAVSVGLICVNLIKPGNSITEATRSEMLNTFGHSIDEKVDEVHSVQSNRAPLQPLIDIIPENIFESASSNSNMLQIIFFSLFLGIAMILLPFEEIKPFKDVLDAGNSI